MHFLACACLEMNAFESTQSNARSTLDIRELEVELHNLVSSKLAGIGRCHVGAVRLSRGYRSARHTEIAVTELRVAQAVSKRIERLAGEIAVRPVGHPVVLKVRQLIDSRIEGDR